MKTMYSWSDYEAAMKQINKSQLSKNHKSPKSWAKFKITELPFSNQRWAAFFRGLHPYRKGKYLDSGVVTDNGIVSYQQYLNWGYKDNNNKWRSYEQRIPAIYVLDNKWIFVQTKYEGIPGWIKCYYFDETGDMKIVDITEEINQLFDSIGTQRGGSETSVWTNGLPDYDAAYKNKKNKDGQFYWVDLGGGGFRGMNTHLTISELVYRMVKGTTEDNKSVIWGGLRDGSETPTIRGLNYEAWINKTLQHFNQSTSVVIPPELPWIINWQNLNAFIGKLLT